MNITFRVIESFRNLANFCLNLIFCSILEKIDEIKGFIKTNTKNFVHTFCMGYG